MTNDDEYAKFQELLARHFAALADISARYTAKLHAPDREWFFEQTLTRAWEQRQGFNPSRQRLTTWWAVLCKQVALSRVEWTVSTITGDKIVLGKHLHCWGRGQNGSDWI